MKRKKPIISTRVAILQLGLIIFDFVIDILFASKKAPQVEWLYIPNTIILILSLTINLILALIIIYNESSSNQKFKKWSSANPIILSIFTILASSYIGALNILQSSVFKAEFSKAARNKILWGTTLDVFIEDLPQIIILVLYIRTGIYDIITLLALVSSCLTLTVHMISRLYQVVRHYRDKRDIGIVLSDDGSAGGEDVIITPPKIKGPKGPHPLQFTPEQDNNREIEAKPLGQGIGGDDSKGKVVPDVVVDSQVDENNEEAKINKRGSRSSFKEMF